jgi:hypothetical protein
LTKTGSAQNLRPSNGRVKNAWRLLNSKQIQYLFVNNLRRPSKSRVPMQISGIFRASY